MESGATMNSLLQLQLKQHCGKIASVPPKWKPLTDAVDQAYDAFDRDRRKLEKSLALRSDELTLAHLQLDKRGRELEAANQELEAFTYSVSHDLRAPLRHIDGFVDLLGQRAAGKLDERERYYLNVVADSSKRMGLLIDDLLAFSRAGRTELRCARISMESLVPEVIKTALQSEPSEHRIVWKIGPLPEVDADASMLRQVWVNLIGNAIKYSRPREPAEIWIGADEAETEVVFFVRDNGVGFDMQYADKLFGVFQRLHRAEDFAGTGIGLANVRRMVTRLGGRVRAESRKDEGATFFFSVPKRPQEPKGLTPCP